MRNFVLILLCFTTAFSHGQGKFSYDSHWENIEKQEQKQGKLKSLLPQVEMIYQQAQKENNTPQKIKALLYKSKIILQTDDSEDVDLTIIEDFEKEIKNARPVETALMQSMLAELYQNYYQRNRFKIEERTEIENSLESDFRFWSKGQFEKKVEKLYSASLTPKAKLQNEAIEYWSLLLIREKETEFLRPTLYDFLAYRTLDFFKEGLAYNSSSEKQEESKEILEDLIKFHEQKGNENALAYNRLNLSKLQSEELGHLEFGDCLLQLSRDFQEIKYSPYILYELSEYYLSEHNSIAKTDFEKRKKAAEKSMDYLNQIIENFPESPLRKVATNNKKFFKRTEIGLSMEGNISPHQNTPISFTHKNTDKVYFKILQLNTEGEKLLYEFQYVDKSKKQEKLNQILRSLPLEKEFELSLKKFDDYQNHTTKVKFPSLETGSYVILVSNDADFKIEPEQTKIIFNSFTVTSYAIGFQGNQILLTHRETGLPIKNKTVEVYQQRNRTRTKLETITTDAFGKATYKLRDRTQLSFKIAGENTFLDFGYSYYSPNQSRDGLVKKTQFFTDRKIYRPGQTLYYKVLAFTDDKANHREVQAKQNITIKLHNANRELVMEQNLKTNEFGAASGEFVIPASGLTGQYSLSSSFNERHNYQSEYRFKVEEYKRPKFEVTFQETEEVLKLDETAIFHGNAKAYSGANISDAEVKYRVYRQEVFPYWPWWRHFPQRTKREIAQGETSTDKNGKFKVDFKAIAESKGTSQSFFRGGTSDKKTYVFTITAEVTDLNGETHSAEKSIRIGELSYVLNIPISEKLNKKEWDSIPIKTENLNYQFSPAQGEIKLTKLNAPKRILRESSLATPDYELYDKEEFIDYFPNEPFAEENKPEHWEKGKTVLNRSFDTEKKQSIAINAKNWDSGYYKLEAFIVDGKDTIPHEKIIYLFNPVEDKPVDNELFSANLNKEEFKPGEKAVVSFSSADKDSKVLVELEADGEIVKSEWITLNSEVKQFKFPILESYRGNVFVHYYFGKYNTAKSKTLTVSVPYEDTSLKIQTKTFRDKLKPGTKETWELNISGKNKDKVLAELLATMYDASLDQFASNNNSFNLSTVYNQQNFSNWKTNQSFKYDRASQAIKNYRKEYLTPLNFDRLNWFGLIQSFHRYSYPPMALESVAIAEADVAETRNVRMKGSNSLAGSADGVAIEDSERKPESAIEKVIPRRALQETAFFYPHLQTDENGNVKIKFTVPESLTEWKFMATAHTKDLRTGYLEKKVKTQKELMVVPNPPRFLRAGDDIRFSTKISNLSDKDLKGEAKLQLFDAFTMQPIDGDFENNENLKNFEVDKDGNVNLAWELAVPEDYQTIVYRITASTGEFSDGEENALPVLTNRKLVTESLPIFVREGQEKSFTLDKLQNTKSKTLESYQLTFEMTQNPIWYAVFSLPYLREPANSNSISDFGWLYGNLISRHLINANPKIKTVFKDWNQKGQLKSKLEQNQELKKLLLEETPWVRDAESEAEQMKRIAVLFDDNKIQNDLNAALLKLKQKQSAQGGFPWFEGGNDNRFITTYIVSGFGHLKALGVTDAKDMETKDMLKSAIRYLDQEAIKEYELKSNNDNFSMNSYGSLYYLYARSMFLEEFPLSKKAEKLRDEILKELDKNKFELSLSSQAMTAMVFKRYNKNQQAKTLLNSVKDHAVNSDKNGMYWKANKPGWLWQEAPINTQALLIEAFDEILNDEESVESMKVWLLKQRQTNRWSSVKATTEAVYALLKTGKSQLTSTGGVSVKVGQEELDLSSSNRNLQSGTGYLKTSWNRQEIKPEMATVEVKKESPGVSWGALYWQYFEDLDKISSAETGLKIEKELFLKKNTKAGVRLKKIEASTPIEVGDLVTVRVKIKSDRTMQFVHLKDMRASGFEPVNVISRYKHQDGLFYYESTRDASTNFFMDNMAKGTYVFEYDLRANNSGEFSNGITTLQNMYAPELSTHSEGIRIEIK